MKEQLKRFRKKRGKAIMKKELILQKLVNSFFIGLMLFTLTGDIWAAEKPNVILIMADDQGYGDFGIKGNHLVQTPHIDAMARQSFEFTRFYVNAVCSPTRASVMTGRQSYRTGVTDTWIGRSTMFTEEVTIAEILKGAGYGTALFGKWHLGDSYPYRPMDQGFDKAIYHLGGGLGQPADPIENERRYTNAILMDNGKKFKSKGFCCDVYFSEAMKWMKKQKSKPFFAFIATNTPHSPLHDVPQKWLEYYKKKDLSKANFKQSVGHSISGKDNNDRTAAVYAMVSNIDDNVGRLFKFLKEQQLLKNTLVIYMSDNGPDSYRYVGGFKGKKTLNTEGGLRSPIWFYYPQEFDKGGKSHNLSAHVDLFPTLADFCGVKVPSDRKIDGISLLSALKGQQMNKRRTSVILQSHRGEKPERLKNTAIYRDQWKLMTLPDKKLALFDMGKDPFAKKNIIDKHPEISRALIAEYDLMFNELDQEYENMWDAKPAHVGTKHEEVTFLSRQDWRKQIGPRWHVSEANGTWYLDIKKSGQYKILFNLLKPIGPLKATLKLNSKSVANGSFGPQDWYGFPSQKLNVGPLTLKIDINDSSKIGPWHVKVVPVK
jgi:arylsulfatase A-like enzyme